MTFAELYAFVGGYVKAQGGEDRSNDPTASEYLRILAEEKVAGRA
jgi:hypothetical protein